MISGPRRGPKPSSALSDRSAQAWLHCPTSFQLSWLRKLLHGYCFPPVPLARGTTGNSPATATLPSARRLLAGALLLAGASGWFGIFSRKLYAAPRWIEPWEQVAREAAEVTGNGGIVIGNNPPFFC